MKKNFWFVYILECGDGSFYTGVTKDLNKRMKAHAEGYGSKYVYRKGFRRLLKSKLCENKSEACKFEYTIKQLPRRKKLEWFEGIQPKTTQKTVEKTVEKILRLIKENPMITQEELSNKMNLTRRGIEWNINKLKQEKKIKRVGPDKGGYWKIINTN